MKKTIAVLPGDGVGPEVTNEAIKVLKKIAEKYQHEFSFTEGLIGSAAIDATSDPFPKTTQALCQSSDAILFGAIGSPKYDKDPNAKVRPEQGLLKMRKILGLYANIRPIYAFKHSQLSPLRPEITKNVDFVVVRELTSGIYFGKRGRAADGTSAYDTCTYTKEEIERVAKIAFSIAQSRKSRPSSSSKPKVTLVDKANVLETSRLWREVVQQIAKEYEDITVEYMFVDNAAMQIMKNPASFDVILTDNMFGDILTDEASIIAGSLGMLPSASIGSKVSLFEPIHGSFPKAAGQNRANPVGTILSASMLLAVSFGLEKESKEVFAAVNKVLDSGKGTVDIVKENPLSTSAFGDAVVAAL